MILGTLLILSALGLMIYNQQEDAHAGKASEKVLREMKKEPEEGSGQIFRPEIQRESMTVREIDGYGYIGYLSIPVLGLELPVMDQWTYKRLRIAPCRQFGSTFQDNLVIAAHNYKRHFGSLASLVPGDTIRFTDMDGEVTEYKVGCVETIPPASTEKVKDSPWDIILYTCTYGGKSRIMAGASRIEKPALS